MPKLAPLALAIVLLGGCHRKAAFRPPEPWQEGFARPHLKRIWRLPDLEATTSVLDAQPPDRILLALGAQAAGRRDLVAVDVQQGVIRWRAPLSKWRGTSFAVVESLALAADDRRNLTAFALETGQQLWKSQLDCYFQAGDRVESRGQTIVGRCTRSSSAPDRGEGLLIDARDGTQHGYESWHPWPRWADGLEARLPQKHPSGCWATSHLAEFPLYQYPQQKAVLRSGRKLWMNCDEVSLVDDPGLSWRPPETPDLPLPAVTAVDLRGSYLQMLLSRRDAPGLGHVVVFDGPRLALIAEAPALDPQLVTMSSGVIVVRRGGEQARVGEALGLFAPEPTALEGYAIAEPEGTEESPDAADRAHVRRLVRAGGKFDWQGCEPGLTRFDRVTFGALLAIPNWQGHVAALLADPDWLVQNGALAAAVEARSPDLTGALVGALRDLARPFDRATNDIHEQEGTWRGREETGWYDEAYGAIQSRRYRLASVLVRGESPAAIPVLGPLLLEDHELGYQRPGVCAPLIPAVCKMLAALPLPAARGALEAYDRKFDAPGAWKALCDRR